MKKNKIGLIFFAIILLIGFCIWTVLVQKIDLQPIGPENSVVGFATMNSAFHKLTGVHLGLYHATDWLEILPFAICGLFGIVGLVQWIQRKNMWKVDADILLLGASYIIVIAAFFLFEKLTINFRPILIEGVLEASYPSSTTMLTISVLPTAMMQAKRRIPSRPLLVVTYVFGVLLTVYMLVGRMLSGVHWLSDIIGAALFGGGMVLLYAAVIPEKKA